MEAQAVAKLHKHPNIVKIYSIAEEGGQHFFAMQLIRGGSLKERLGECVADPRRAVEIIIKVADAIAHAHRRGVLHRDLKPDNILIDEEGSPYVTDFGLAKRVNPSEGVGQTIGPGPVAPVCRERPPRSPSRGFDSSETEGGSILGTPSSVPPEQAQGRLKDVSTLSDVYSLGATFFAMLCHRPPFAGTTVQEVLNQVISETPPSPRALNGRVNRDLDAICLKCIEKDPQATVRIGRGVLARPPSVARRQAGPRPADLDAGAGREVVRGASRSRRRRPGSGRRWSGSSSH